MNARETFLNARVLQAEDPDKAHSTAVEESTGDGKKDCDPKVETCEASKSCNDYVAALEILLVHIEKEGANIVANAEFNPDGMGNKCESSEIDYKVVFYNREEDKTGD